MVVKREISESLISRKSFFVLADNLGSGVEEFKDLTTKSVDY